MHCSFCWNFDVFGVLQLAFLQVIYISTLNYITDTISPDVVYFYFIVYML